MSDVLTFSSDQARDLLPAILARAGARQAASEQDVRLFLDYTQTAGLEWNGWATIEGGRVTGAAVAVLPPGGTAVVSIGAPGALSIRAADQRRVLERLLHDLSGRGLYFAQCLLEQDDAPRRATFEQAGFRPLAALEYRERAPTPLPPVARDPAGIRWVTYREAGEATFRKLVSRTYVDTLDCAELPNLRPTDAVLEGHRAVGSFDPTLWLAAVVDGAPAGCVLLAWLGALRVVEVVYMGVIATHRRAGLGGRLLRRALEEAKRLRARQVALVVDAANEPALRLYDRFGFAVTSRRDAMIFPWSGRAPG